MRRLEWQSGFPGASPESAVLHDRWEALLDRTPRLRPWLSQMVERRRMVLAERLGRDAGEEIERILSSDLDRWLRDFEALPNYAVSAIALDLCEEPLPKAAERPKTSEPAGVLECLEARSPENAAC